MLQPSIIQADSTLDIDAESAILVDAKTGKVLYAKNPDEALPPASMTKMMTEYLVWEAVESGDFNWDDTTQISDYPYGISANPSFSGIGLKQGTDYTIQSLYEAMAINSDNAATIALAEEIAGSEGEFVKLMNEKAEEMGLHDFKFVNTTGLENESLGDNYPEGTDPKGINLLSARSAALLAYHLVNDYPEALEIASIPATEFDGQTITNYNWMLAHEGSNLKQYHYEGVDGLKTGNTDLAGYCFTGTAERDGQRLISVVMKTDSEDQRFKETIKLFDYGYDNFADTEIFKAGYQLDDQQTLPVEKGKNKEVNIAIKDAFNLPIKKNQKEDFIVQYTIDEKLLTEDGNLIAPIKKGTKVGTAELVNKDGIDYGYITPGVEKETQDLVVTEDIEKKNWFMNGIDSVGGFFMDLFSTIFDKVKGWF